MRKVPVILILLFACFAVQLLAQQPLPLYKLKKLESRAASSENRLAEKGKGGTSKNGLTGSPAIKDFRQETTETLLNTDGPGMIRHIWCTVSGRAPTDLRNIILRMYWEHHDVPSVEVPLGDFFGNPVSFCLEDFHLLQIGTALHIHLLQLIHNQGIQISFTQRIPDQIRIFTNKIDI